MGVMMMEFMKANAKMKVKLINQTPNESIAIDGKQTDPIWTSQRRQWERAV
jgi:hypothetical protein